VSLLSLHGVSLSLANHCILDNVDWQLHPQDKVALVGRNGAGKSTFLKLLQNDIVADKGKIDKLNGLRIASLSQDVPITGDETVYHFLVKGLGETGEILTRYRFEMASDKHPELLAELHQKLDNLQAWELLPRIETMATRLDLNVDIPINALSGGMKRRVLLAAALIVQPDILLLDEPTNHLDMNAIEWLESYLKNYTGGLLIVTHDREFLAHVSNRILEIDRGRLNRFDCSYETYLDRREAMRLCEQKHNALFDKRLSEEEAWLRMGIKARRTRNEGRVRALKAMRLSYQQRRSQLGKVKAQALDVSRSGHLVIEATQLNHAIGGKKLVRDFSFLLTRGDKVGIIGANGCGKTTLVRLLLGELSPDSGQVRQGTSLNIAYFDQLRRQLNEQETVLFNVGDGSDFITINGQQKHVASYLKEFLFPPERFNQPVFSLSGGERNRLLLAKLFAKPINLLVMDEPTNDLDIETLELLENILIDFTGTLLLISHDRAFINQVVTSVLIYEEDGRWSEYVGGYEDYRRYKKQQRDSTPAQITERRPNTTIKLSFNEQRELLQLPQKIEALEKQIEIWHQEMATTAFYQQDVQKISAFNQQVLEQENQLATMYKRWEMLEAKNGSMAS